MRAEENSLDLNNFPEDSTSKDGKQAGEACSFSVGGVEEESGFKEGKEERGKVYECRFCTLKFSKSQALGGHMNRHRQERETESLNRARQLLFGDDPLHHYHHHHHHLGAYHPGSHVSDPILAFRPPPSSMYPQPLPPPPGRLFSASSSGSSSSPLLQPYIYQSSPVPYPSNDFTSGSHGLINRSNQYLGLHGTITHAYTSGSTAGSSDSSTNYTCIGAPVGEVLGGGGDPNQREGLSWGKRSI